MSPDDFDLDRFLDASIEAPAELFPDVADDPERDGYLAIGVEPRDCRNTAGLRPCPFVGCRSHLLLDEIHNAAYPEPSLTLNRARLPVFQPDAPERGRRRELAPTVPLDSADDHAFQRRAVERLWELPETCARDVARRGGCDVREVARLMGADEDEIGMDLDDATCALRGAALVMGADPEDGESMAVAMVAVLRITRTE